MLLSQCHGSANCQFACSTTKLRSTFSIRPFWVTIHNKVSHLIQNGSISELMTINKIDQLTNYRIHFVQSDIEINAFCKRLDFIFQIIAINEINK